MTATATVPAPVHAVPADAPAFGPGNGGRGYDRLVQVKRTYDPENLFHLNPEHRPGYLSGRRPKHRYPPTGWEVTRWA